jgi:hypothetical protein
VDHFIASILAYPTVFFTLPLGMSLAYWLFVIVGAVDLDFLDSIGGAAEALDGADGVIDGAADGVIDGVADGASDGAVESLQAEIGSLAIAANLLRLGRVPITISFSFLFLLGWLICGIGASILTPFIPSSGWLSVGLNTLLGFGSFIASLSLTHFVTQPFEWVLKGDEATRSKDLVGQIAKLTTVHTNENFGQARLFYKGSEMNLPVRCNQANDLKKGDEIILLSHNAQKEAYTVQGYQTFLGQNDALHDDFARLGAAIRADSPHPCIPNGGETEKLNQED